MKGFIIFCIIYSVVLIAVVSSQIQTGVNSNIGVNFKPTPSFNYSVVNTNSSNFWDLLDTPADIFSLPNANLSGSYGYADKRTATLIVCANDSLNKGTCDYQADGVNDEVEIQSAINSLPYSFVGNRHSYNGKVVLLEGTYNLNDTINIVSKDNVILQGMGKATKIKSFLYRSPIPFPAGTDYYLNKTIDISNSQGVDISGLNFVQPANYGIYGVLSFKNKIHNNYFDACCDSGAIFFQETYYDVIDKNLFMSTGIYGIKIVKGTYQARNELIINNIFSNYNFPIYLDGVRSSTISNNIMDESVDNSITILNSNRLTLFSNLLSTPGKNGIDIVNVNESLITGNVIIQSGDNIITGENIDGNGIYLGSYNYNNLVLSNRLGLSKGYGVNIDINNFGNMISNNNLYDNSLGTLNNSGANSTIIGNYPGGSSMEIQSAQGQEIKIIPWGNLTTIFYSENTTSLVNYFGKNITINNSLCDVTTGLCYTLATLNTTGGTGLITDENGAYVG